VKLAIIGTGISGLVAAHRLWRDRDVTVFEAADWIGGHTHTVDVGRHAVDTGFIVYNDRTYPNFVRLLDELGVATQPSTMSFSVKCERTGLEYNPTTLNSLFAQRRNLMRPSFYGLVREILRFNREAPALLDDPNAPATLGEYLERGRYSRAFIEQYLVPMGAAIWSTDPGRFRSFPARFFVQFFANHGMLTVDDRPQWRVVTGGSRRYVDALIRPFADRIRTRTPVVAVTRMPDGVEVTPRGGPAERFDQVVFATHSDTALRLLTDAGDAERDILGALPYQSNDVVLHTDARVLPCKRAWGAWNYHVLEDESRVTVTYHMNLLQSLRSPCPFLVTLNRTEAIDPALVLARFTYDHPLYTPAGVAAQARWEEISGRNRTHFCGAYWGYGFHEDGVKSGLRVSAALEAVHA